MIFGGPFGYAKCKEILMKYISENDLGKMLFYWKSGSGYSERIYV